ncbi:MAG: STAS domain-containing protein [Candidatus Ozemobacteraceae bacterium]
MKESYSILQSEKDGIVIFLISGYFAEKAGLELVNKIDELLCQQMGKIIIDFGQCTVLSSLGIGCLLEIVGKVIEEFNGMLAFTGLDPLKLKVLTLTHVTALAIVVKTPDQAVECMK